jgi:hypothetical protein
MNFIVPLKNIAAHSSHPSCVPLSLSYNTYTYLRGFDLLTDLY